MTERKTYRYYRPRIQIPIATMFDSAGEYGLYCLPKDGAQAIARITGYLKRAITYIGEVVDDTIYYGPTETEMSMVIDIIGELEVGLMSECDFADIVDRLDQMIAVMQQAADCQCQATSSTVNAIGQLPAIGGYVGEGNVTYKNETDARADYTDPTLDAEKCELAQAHYWFVWEAYTEKILPWANSTADNITAAIVATASFAGVATFIGLPVAVLSAVVAVLVNWAIDGSIENFVNWLYASRDDIVCAIYLNLPDLDACEYALNQVIDTAPELSTLDRALLKSILASQWFMTFVFADQETNGTWDNYIEGGFCSVCAAPVASCKPVLDYDAADWSGGFVVNQNNRGVIIGGTATYINDTMTVPAYPSQLQVEWIPRSDDSLPSTMAFGVTEVLSGKIWTLGTTPSRENDVQVTEYALFPSLLAGLEVYVNGKQVSQNIELSQWCVASLS